MLLFKVWPSEPSISVTQSLLEIQTLRSLPDLLTRNPHLTRSSGDSYAHRSVVVKVRKTLEPNNLGWKPGPTTHQLDDLVPVTGYFLRSEELISSKERSWSMPLAPGRGSPGSRNVQQRCLCSLRALATDTAIYGESFGVP